MAEFLKIRLKNYREWQWKLEHGNDMIYLLGGLQAACFS